MQRIIAPTHHITGVLYPLFLPRTTHGWHTEESTSCLSCFGRRPLNESTINHNRGPSKVDNKIQIGDDDYDYLLDLR